MIAGATVKEELRVTFGQIFDCAELVTDVAAVSEFLTDFDRMCVGLAKLNAAFKAEMGHEAVRSLGYYNEKIKYYEDLIEYSDAKKFYDTKMKYSTAKSKYKAPIEPVMAVKPPELKKALSNAFFREEFSVGFGAPNVYLGFLKSETFNGYLRKKMHWKDPTVPLNHGEYTHRIQWYCISSMQIVKRPAELFAVLGGTPYEKNKERGLWDFVCDRDGGEAGFVPFKTEKNETCTIAGKKVETDFRAPETLTKFLIESLKDEKFQEFAELATFVKMRIIKRNVVKFNDLNYVAKKAFNKNYSDLEPAERAEVNAIKELGVFSPK